MATIIVAASLALALVGVSSRASASGFQWLLGRNGQSGRPAAPSAVCTFNGSVDNNWATVANWTGCTGGGAPVAADSVLLDNSLKAGTYTLSLPTGAVNTTIVKLTITPGAGNTITLVLPSGNTNNPGLTVGDSTIATDDLILNNGGVFQNSSGAGAGNGIAFASAANDTMRINNGGRYLHNTLRGNAGIVSQLSTAAGTESGIFEFDVPGLATFSLSASGRTFGSLTLTRTAGAASYTVSGGSALTIKGNLTINTGVTFSSTMTGALNLAGNLTNNGVNLAIPATQAVNFNGNTTVTGSASVSIASAASTITAGNTLALGAVTFSNSGTLTISGNLQINQGGFPGGAGTYSYNAATGSLIFNNSAGSFAINNDNYWPAANGPQNVNVQGGGGITMNAARTVGTLFQYSTGVSGANNLTLTGTTKVNPGGFTSGSPTYGGVSSLLRYNTGGTYARNGEWLPGATSGAGYPTHVQLSNNTTLDLVNSSNSPFQMSGDLTIDSGSTMQLSGATPLTNPLTIFGSVNNNGILNFSNSAGGDVNVGGSWNNNGTFNNNGRTVNLNGSIGQAISGNSTFFNLTKNTAVAQTLTFAAGCTQTVTNLLTLNGAAGNLLSLRSSISGTQWKINAPGTQSVNFVDAKDSDASGGTVITPGSSVDSGNNLNWVFAGADYTVTTTANTIVVSDVSDNSDTLTISEPADGLIKFSAPGRNFSVDGGPVISGDSGNLNLVGIAFITVNQNAGNDQMVVNTFGHSMCELTINGGVGNDTVHFSGALAFQANRNLDVDLQNDDASPGVDQIFLDAAGNLQLNGAGTATLKASQSIVMNPGSLLQVAGGDVTLEANQQASPTAGNFRGIAVNGATLTTTSTGNISLKGKGGTDITTTSHYGVSILPSAVVSSTSVSAGAGTITIEGNGAAGLQNNRGVEVAATGTVSSVRGDIQITGTGGTGGPNNYGISVINGGVVSSTGVAKITFNGTGGNGTSSSIGSRISGEDTKVTSAGGDISITGQGGTGTGASQTGVSMSSGALVSATNGAKITMNGTAGSGTALSFGVAIGNFGPTNLVPAKVTSDSGDISFTGTGGSGGFGNIGWNIDTKAVVVATGSANISINGTGGTGTTDNYGVGFEGGGEAGTGVSAVNGNIIITGVATNPTGTDEDGVRFEDSVDTQAALLTTTGTGTVTITGTGAGDDATSSGINIVDDCTMSFTGATNTFIADTMDIGNSNVSINAGANSLTLRPKTNDRAIDLGGADSATQLGLTDAELDVITAGTINIGDANSGAITVSAPITRPTASNMTLTSGANIDLASSLNSNGGDVTLLPTTNNVPSGSGVDVTTSATKTLTLAAFKNLTIVINSTTVDTGYTQLNVAGLVNLNNAQLAMSGTHTPAINEQFIIVNNDGADPIVGTFNSLPQGTVIPNFLGSAQSARITYTGGDGNDAVVIVNSPTASHSSISGQIVDTEGLPVAGAAVRLNGTQNRLTMSDKFGNYHFDNVETGGFYSVTPTRVNYSFNPIQRNFSQLGANTEAVFTGAATGTFFNPLDTTEYFVRQQYLDFLGREPDEAGLNFWVNNIESCGPDFNCRAAKREDTSAAFFLSIEFHETGYLAYRAHQAAFGDLPGAPVPVDFNTFRADTAKLGEGLVVNATGWQDKLESNKQAFLAEFVARERFTTAYPTTLSPSEFVGRLAETAGVTLQPNELQTAVAEFGGAQDSANATARAQVLRRIAENATLDARERNSAFVLLQYFGYLGRDPNAAPDGNFNGYQFWLNKLESFHGDFRRAEMVKAFLIAGEYRGRFPR
jgi:hypothetical protein